MSPKLIQAITYVSSFSPLIPLIIGFIRVRHLSKWQKILLVILATSFLTEGVALLLANLKINNYIAYNIYAVINFNLIWFLFQSENKKLRNKAIWVVQASINLLALLNAIYLQPITTFNSNIWVVGSISYLIFTFYSFRQILQAVQFSRLEKSPFFWFNTGVVIYYSGSLVLFLLSNQINNINESAYNLHMAVWALNSSFNFILIVTYCLALWVRPTK